MAAWIFFYWILDLHGGAVTANSMIFNEYAWTNRLVILITNNKNTDLEKKSEGFLNAMFVTLTIEI